MEVRRGAGEEGGLAAEAKASKEVHRKKRKGGFGGGGWTDRAGDEQDNWE